MSSADYNHLILVLGMRRSGILALTRVINPLGVDLCPAQEAPGHASLAKPLKNLTKVLGRKLPASDRAVLKDPRLCRNLPSGRVKARRTKKAWDASGVNGELAGAWRPRSIIWSKS